MRSFFLAVMALMVVSSPARAEEPAAAHRLTMTLSRRPTIAPPPDLRVADQDTEQAIRRLETRERGEKALGRWLPKPPPRPDLSYDVFGAIQSRRVLDALGRR